MEVLDYLARKLGKVKEVQLTPKLFFEGNYVRFRVRINIEKALLRFVTLTMPKGMKRSTVKYEKVMFFCKHCGFLGHDHEECGDGVWERRSSSLDLACLQQVGLIKLYRHLVFLHREPLCEVVFLE
jgi:hypothetical protein